METVTNLTKRFQALRGRVENTSDELEYLPLHDTAPLKRRNPLRSIAAIVLITILCLLSFWAGYVVKGQYEQPTMIAGTAPRGICPLALLHQRSSSISSFQFSSRLCHVNLSSTTTTSKRPHPIQMGQNQFGTL